MTTFIDLLVIGIGAFVASNIDDTFVLILLFSSPSIRARDVIIGQFLGIVLFVVISSFAAFLVLAIPLFAIGLMGLIPIIIGIKRLSELRETPKIKERYSKKEYLSFLSVVAITVSNGGDDIGVLTPLFANYNAVAEVIFFLSLFMIMTAIWCIVTYYFLRHPFVASRINPISRIVSPLGLIALGIYILLDSFYF
jgi:cadmium resistance protein CadD (predicted permease)